jgi:hypothetical protein
VLRDAFLLARTFVFEKGYLNEIRWQDSISLELLTENTFLQEYAWVVLNSGMREAVVRKKFPLVSHCFHSWESASKIADDADLCVRSALEFFRHEAKIRAVAVTAKLIAAEGFAKFKERVETSGLATLRELSYIGPITQYHLAKNIGMNVAKPDRHLVRIAHLFGYETVQEFCGDVAKQTCSKVAVVDVVFWRFATLRRDYLEVLTQFASATEQSPSCRPS